MKDNGTVGERSSPSEIKNRTPCVLRPLRNGRIIQRYYTVGRSKPRNKYFAKETVTLRNQARVCRTRAGESL